MKGRSSHVWVACPVCGKEVQRAEFAVSAGLFESCAVCRPPVAGHCPESVWDEGGRWLFCSLPWSHQGRCSA